MSITGTLAEQIGGKRSLPVLQRRFAGQETTYSRLSGSVKTSRDGTVVFVTAGTASGLVEKKRLPIISNVVLFPYQEAAAFEPFAIPFEENGYYRPGRLISAGIS